jgi:hypothetical protein
MLGLFRWLLQLYPVSFSREFSEEMALCFQLRLQDVRHQSWKQRGSFLVREYWGAFTGAMSEQRGSRFVDLFRRFDMRSFRFSRFAMVCMILALIGVGLAIETARHQAVSGFPVEQPARVILSRTLVGLFEAMAILAVILGGIGYVVLRAVSQSGSQRLANAHTWPQERQSPRN